MGGMVGHISHGKRSNPTTKTQETLLRIELHGSNSATATLEGVTLEHDTANKPGRGRYKDPVPMLCRNLIGRGFDPNDLVHVTRNGRPVWKVDRTAAAWAGIDIYDGQERLKTVKYVPFTSWCQTLRRAT